MSVVTAPYLDAIERELCEIVSTTDTDPSLERLFGMMRYHLGWVDSELLPVNSPKGKRLRPVMCLLACEAVGGEWRRAVPAAAAVELIHNFSLLHDDIEDRSDTRRHRATVWRLWGVAQAINTGDTMWALSRLATYRLLDLGHSAEIAMAVARCLDKTCLDLCSGQYLDLLFETAETVQVREYKRMIDGKSAALLSASLATGAIAGGGTGAIVEAYAGFGRELGLTFQITDDILGIWGDPSTTGKSAASDIITKKKTFPVLHAMDWERAKGLDEMASIYRKPLLSDADVARIVACLGRAGARQCARQEALTHHDRAMEHLSRTGAASPAQDALAEIAENLLGRSS